MGEQSVLKQVQWSCDLQHCSSALTWLEGRSEMPIRLIDYLHQALVPLQIALVTNKYLTQLYIKGAAIGIRETI